VHHRQHPQGGPPDNRESALELSFLVTSFGSYKARTGDDPSRQVAELICSTFVEVVGLIVSYDQPGQRKVYAVRPAAHWCLLL
jgi:hypothetical protein